MSYNNNNPGNVQPKKCSSEGCTASYMPHLHGTHRANEEGWFIQRNGDAWCPDHNPDWVAAWREKKKAAPPYQPKANRKTRNICDFLKENP